MKQLAVLNPEGATDAEVRGWRVREAARAVVRDKDGLVALLHVTKDGYYKLPGGGIDEGEEVLDALRRECLEEIGCEIDVRGEVGSVVEHRKMHQLEQASYCYLADVKGEKSAPAFTDDERARGFAIVWMPYEAALEAVSKLAGNEPESVYISKRDSILLQAAGSLMHKEK